MDGVSDLNSYQLRQRLVYRFVALRRIGRKPVAEVDVDNIERSELPSPRPSYRIQIADAPEIIVNHVGLRIYV